LLENQKNFLVFLILFCFIKLKKLFSFFNFCFVRKSKKLFSFFAGNPAWLSILIQEYDNTILHTTIPMNKIKFSINIYSISLKIYFEVRMDIFEFLIFILFYKIKNFLFLIFIYSICLILQILKL